MAGGTRSAAAAAADTSPGDGARPEIARAVSDLALAVQRHRIYPPSSPLCLEAIEAWRASLASLPDGLELQVSPSGVEAGAPLPATAMVEELAGCLFRAGVDAVHVAAGASGAELARFARTLARWDRRSEPESLTERLIDQGVGAVRTRSTERLDVLDVPFLTAAEERTLREERHGRSSRRGKDAGRDPGGAWVRVDTDWRLESLDLADLAVLVEDPAELARILQEARGDRTDGRDRAELLSSGLADLLDLYGALSPGVAGGRLAALARTLTSLEGPSRARLIDGVLVPDLLETGRPAALVAALPDAEIAGMLRRMGERRLGAPGLVEHALERVGLPPERERAVRETLGPKDGADGERGEAAAEPGASLAQGLRQRGGGASGTTLLALAAQDRGVPRSTESALAAWREEATSPGPLEERLRGHVQLVYHLLNPEVAESFLSETTELLGTLLERGEGRRAALWAERLRLAADAVRSSAPEVAGAVDRALLGLCSVRFVRRALRETSAPDSAGVDDGARELVAALGPIAAPRLLEALEEEPSRAARRSVIDFMRQRARDLAPGLLGCLSDLRWTVIRNATAVLGFAGHGHEATLTRLLDHEEPRVASEAFRALARIGSDEAARQVVGRMGSEDGTVRKMACESVRRFPRETGRRMAAEVLADPGFPRRWPGPARELVRHFFDSGPIGAERPALEALLPLRRHLWRPGRARLGWAAAAALRRADR